MEQARPTLWALFHLNLMFSSIEEERRPAVVERCYRPLLDMIGRLSLPIGIEAPGWTIEELARLDPGLVADLRALIAAGRVEFVASGYAQIAGPLVPAAVNRANLAHGLQVYRDLLGVRPTTALVNEQTVSRGLLPLYGEAGFRGLVFDWDNTIAHQPDWDLDLGRWPLQVEDGAGPPLTVLWSRSVGFQKVQRYVHGELDLEEILEWLDRQRLAPGQCFPLYTNDAEVFGFRPGRFQTEAAILADEWLRLEDLFRALSAPGRYGFLPPAAVCASLEQGGRGVPVESLTSAEAPVLVKKQGKYSVLRWAVAGRDSAVVNAACHRLAAARHGLPPDDAGWREVLYLWSSDFRTHITEARWTAFRAALAALSPPDPLPPDLLPPDPMPAVPLSADPPLRAVLEANGARLEINLRRGATVRSFRPAGASGSLCGTIPHGDYEDIRLAADWYTGHVVLEPSGVHKITDLEQARTTGQEATVVRSQIDTPLGPVCKIISLGADGCSFRLRTALHWPQVPAGSLRLGTVTLDPSAFDVRRLSFATTNGGGVECFPLRADDVDHGRPTSANVSASCAVGMTDGWIAIGDDHQHLRLEFDPGLCATPVGMVKVLRVRDEWFARVTFSLQEIDDTFRGPRHYDAPLVFDLTVTAVSGAPGAGREAP